MKTYKQVLPKPCFGKPCNGCGLCCAEQPCAVATELGFTESPCGILEDVGDGSFVCGLTTNPYQYVPNQRAETWKAIDNIGKVEGIADLGKSSLKSYFKNRLAIGRGCDSSSDMDQNR